MKAQSIERKLYLESELKKNQEHMVEFDRIDSLDTHLDELKTKLALLNTRAEDPVFMMGIIDLEGQRAELQAAIKSVESDLSGDLEAKKELECSTAQILSELEGIKIWLFVVSSGFEQITNR
ncbi:hypothetical protein [Desulfofustis glycolicus]|uniref:Uncharacterized protein n=1 Tax=Desulfofustis glycolicus DSM 9705 TaxID=1121409 RepID=A0A1M5RUL6_9BACT|nr:hypothetical protein [Desulfofustis glycolicus]SHH29926.1 hypothetical protein SAMN02745124_00002 [Desulfofustis glycolicus DSM 9705]